eukprot:6135677-Amphidinium_carterae.1
MQVAYLPARAYLKRDFEEAIDPKSNAGAASGTPSTVVRSDISLYMCHWLEKHTSCQCVWERWGGINASRPLSNDSWQLPGWSKYNRIGLATCWYTKSLAKVRPVSIG